MAASIADKEDLMNAVRDTAARVHAARIECISTGTTAQYETLLRARFAYEDACKALIDRLIIGLDLSPVPVRRILESFVSPVQVAEDDTAGAPETTEQPDAVVLLADREPVAEEDAAGTQLTARPGDPTIPEAGE